MARGAMEASCLSCVVKPCVTANEDGPRRRCPKASKYGSRTKDHKGISEGPNGRNIKRRIQSIPTLHSLSPLKRFMLITLKPSIRLCDDAVRPIEDVPIGMQRRQDDSKNGEMCTGLC